MSEKRTVAIVVTGRVQGVGYRAWTRREAERFGVSGHVLNRAAGAVEAVLHDPAEAVEAMIGASRKRPPAARVADVRVSERFLSDLPSGFRILAD